MGESRLPGVGKFTPVSLDSHQANREIMSLDKNISDYESYHQDPVNIKIHVVCVPLIILSVLGMLNMIPIAWGPVRVGHVVGLLYFSYYIFYARPYVLPCFAMFGVLIAADFQLAKLSTQLYLSIQVSIFVLGWILQFWGHKKEGNQPAFIANKESGLHSMFMAPILVVRHIGIRF